MSSAATGRASMDMREMRTEGTRADSTRRGNTVTESMRQSAGPAAVAFYAQANPAINTSMTHRNLDMVNDGDGGYRAVANIREVVAYGDERVELLGQPLKVATDAHGQPQPGHRFAVTSVGHLPMSMCEPDGTHYQPLDRETGEPKLDQYGEPVLLPRYRAKDHDEMVRYFEAYIAQQEAIYPGGHDSIHGFSINLDESRPHIQILADPFAPDPRREGKLRNEYSRAFGSHRDDRMVPQVDRKTGAHITNADGSAKLVREGAARKMERYHSELKARMLDLGFDIEAERDPVRHARSQGLADYKDLQDDRRSTLDDAVLVTEMRAAAQVELDQPVAEYATIEALVTGEVMADSQEQRAMIAEQERQVIAQMDANTIRTTELRAECAQAEAETKRLAEARRALDAERASLRLEAQTHAAEAVSAAVEDWETTELPSLRQKATAEATKDAQAQAQAILDKAGVTATATVTTAHGQAQALLRDARERAEQVTQTAEAEARRAADARAADHERVRMAEVDAYAEDCKDKIRSWAKETVQEVKKYDPKEAQAGMTAALVDELKTFKVPGVGSVLDAAESGAERRYDTRHGGMSTRSPMDKTTFMTETVRERGRRLRQSINRGSSAPMRSQGRGLGD